ncbi:hypothetical protein THAOC_12767 [Thalassiosira oceanica]|uniref:Uncharacterized protein n=1 Tax=Thalassiosira oceanica TaxID=159749 RepID=K0SLX3_THAOC|nr:hypothetical protein THAOC_12767 [Thalassiosira oceanica]|eukprot:EJK66320.1 hypothetical protein THAOC_12767 [Thalassiosira oceanica]
MGWEEEVGNTAALRAAEGYLLAPSILSDDDNESLTTVASDLTALVARCVSSSAGKLQYTILSVRIFMVLIDTMCRLPSLSSSFVTSRKMQHGERHMSPPPRPVPAPHYARAEARASRCAPPRRSRATRPGRRGTRTPGGVGRRCHTLLIKIDGVLEMG